MLEMIGVVIAITFVLMFIASIINAGKEKQAKSSMAVKATVKSVMPGKDNYTMNVVFEKESGARVNLSVPKSKCTFVAGDTGMLKEANNTFGSFIKSAKLNENAVSALHQSSSMAFDDLEKLARLKEQEVITEEEFNKMKTELLEKL